MIFIGGSVGGEREMQNAKTCHLAGVFYIDGAMKRTVVRGTNFKSTQKTVKLHYE
jgi:hypothetical protein